MKNESAEILLAVAIEAARTAGTHAKDQAHRRHERLSTTTHDVKLKLDVESQQLAEAVIQHHFPLHDIVGEESENNPHSDTYQWIIDPIDGTTNFSHGNPYWCSSVAVQLRGEILAGCVYAPESDSCYTAYHQGPALKNGAPIHCSTTSDMGDALAFTGLTPNMETPGHPHLQLFHQLIYSTRKVRINGAAALDLCRLAEGAADLYIEERIYLWDCAAAGLIARQAGAWVELIPRTDHPFALQALAATPALKEPLKNLFETYIT
jgi:myo-inositol-1(or 4)-monophosphatase